MNDQTNNYKGQPLDRHDFSYRNLVGADFRGASLVYANFVGANLRGAQFRGADVGEANFTSANLTDADFSAARDGQTAIWPTDFDLAERVALPPKPDLTDEEALLARFFREDGTLTAIPVGWTRHGIIMRRVVTIFDWNIHYPEKQLNEMLKQIHPDFATLRRYLVDHKLMTRERNIYWRIGPDTTAAPVASG